MTMISLIIIFLTSSLFLSVIIKKLFYKEEIKPNFFFIIFFINFFIIFLRIFQIILRKPIPATILIIFSGISSFFYLISIFYIKMVGQNRLLPKKTDKTQFLTKVRDLFLYLSTFFLEIFESFKIFVLGNILQKPTWVNWISFLEKYFVVNLQQNTLDNFFIGFLSLFGVIVFVSLSNEMNKNLLFISLLILLAFNVVYRLINAGILLFEIHAELKFFLRDPKISDDYFLDWKFLNEFQNLNPKENDQKVTKLFFDFKCWSKFRRFTLLLKRFSDLKIKLDIFLSLLFVVNFVKQLLGFFFQELYFSIFFDILIYLLLFSLVYQLFIYFFSIKDAEIKKFNYFWLLYDHWAKNNTVNYFFYESPNPPFFKTFKQKLHQTILQEKKKKNKLNNTLKYSFSKTFKRKTLWDRLLTWFYLAFLLFSIFMFFFVIFDSESFILLKNILWLYKTFYKAYIFIFLIS